IAVTEPATTAELGCPQPETGPRVRWRKRVRSSAASRLVGAPHHTSSDPISNPGEDAIITGKFAYGVISKDLVGEDVALWLRMRPCGPWQELARAPTDDDGWISFTVPSHLIPTVGAYPYRLIVRGDLSTASGVIYVLPRATRVAIFDIDGTLTTGDSELLEQIALGADPDMHRGANRVANHYARAGVLPIYITGRPYLLRPATMSWLRRKGFPVGPLITTDSLGAARPGTRGVGRFKQSILSALRNRAGLTIIAAYGNASTDVCAYAHSGIAPNRTYIVGEKSTQCSGYPATRTLTDYVAHLEQLIAAGLPGGGSGSPHAPR
ncbi:MAG: hypothetical protein AAGC55_08970, partial [Myxococcota bacterium]